VDAHVERPDGGLLEQSEGTLMRIEADEASLAVVGDDLEGSQSITIALPLDAKASAQ
jgi:hypothetical protein